MNNNTLNKSPVVGSKFLFGNPCEFIIRINIPQKAVAKTLLLIHKYTK